ncbi:insulinase family protein [Gilvimarinus xylanilyticus]|uniref:Protease 3 n=1 Tax=Gilvimarinus xylanilyticus TaxID=2944139 RepID=A0A9X2KU28_9GAMM|nr:insulinase family protein [Gilvimarinus xylanilyticus]MCP8900476.1 insulinase family protein [Gilvimarinus xylanilyticus]
MKLAKLLVFGVATLAVLISGCSSTTTEPGISTDTGIHQSPNDPRAYQTLTLDNGMRVVLISDPSIEVAGASLSVGVGSYQNPKEIPGLAHYLEHMLFLGTEKYPEPNSFQAFVQQNAGYSNAYTSTDHTNYFFQVNQSVLDEALDRYSDYFKSPTFDPQYSNKERHAVDSEWSMGRTQDGRIINRLRGVTANPDHPAHQMSVGNLETLTDQPGMPLYESMLGFYNRYYSADLMNLVIFGKQPVEQLQALAQKHFASIENKSVKRPQVKETGLTQSQMGQHIFYQPQKPTRQLLVEFPIMDNSDQWAVKPNQYLANLISSEEPGTAAQILREKGWVDNFTVSVQPDYYGADGMLSVNISLTEAGLNQQDNIIAAVMSYIDLIRQQGVDEVYYREYKAMLEKQFADIQVPKPMNQAVHFSSAMFTTPVNHLIDAYYTFDHFDRDAIKNVLEQLTIERARIWHINPNASVDTDIPYYKGQYSVRDVTAQELSRWRGLAADYEFLLPEENDLFSSDIVSVVPATIEKPTLIVEQSGIEAWLAHSMHHQSEQGYVQVMFNTDLPDQNAKNQVMSDLINRVFSLQTTALRDKAGRAGIGMGIERPRGNHAFTLSGYSEKHGLLLQRLLQRWQSMDISQQEFAIAFKGYMDWLDGRKKADPNRQLFTELDRLMSIPSWTDSEYRDAAQAITLEELNRYQDDLLNKNRVRIFAFGNYRQENVEEFADITLAALPENWQKRDRYKSGYVTPQANDVTESELTTEHNDNALLHAYYSPEQSLNTGARLLMLNSVFNQAFYTKLRTEDQVGYIVGSTIDRIGDYWGLVLYTQTTNTALEDLAGRYQAFIDGYAAQLADIEPEVFDSLRDSVIAQVNQAPENFYEDYPRFLNDFYRGNDQFDTRDRLVQAIGETDKAQVVDLYERLMVEHQAQQVTVEIQGTQEAN